MNSYIEEIDLDRRLYEDNVTYHIELIDNTGEVCAYVKVIISYEYAVWSLGKYGLDIFKCGML